MSTNSCNRKKGFILFRMPEADRVNSGEIHQDLIYSESLRLTRGGEKRKENRSEYSTRKYRNYT
jgi:hypothetical protein